LFGAAPIVALPPTPEKIAHVSLWIFYKKKRWDEKR
jgi:hypothetical protein